MECIIYNTEQFHSSYERLNRCPVPGSRVSYPYPTSTLNKEPGGSFGRAGYCTEFHRRQRTSYCVLRAAYYVLLTAYCVLFNDPTITTTSTSSQPALQVPAGHILLRNQPYEFPTALYQFAIGPTSSIRSYPSYYKLGNFCLCVCVCLYGQPKAQSHVGGFAPSKL